ncbi:MAG: SPOR domain-containing protein, partial [Rhizobiaceae bacterium]|nr:SPOR domain-containing protein [Rhizobiaceae bacterium]
DALRAALNAPRPTPSSRMPAVEAVNALAPTGGPVPRGSIPGGGDFDPATTGSIQSRLTAAPSSPWVVQIAAMPDRNRAMDMLSEAKASAGNALVRAEPFTEAVGSGLQTLHRARFAGFQSKTEAAQACAALKKRSYNCFAVSN